ncbi:unnamed protein product [Colias eurytheme]|nr:unnamed protein product [Colias eurytheme]
MHFLDTPGPRHSPPSYISYYESHRYNKDAVLTLKPVTDQAVWKAIRELTSQAVGSDDISLDMLKLTTPSTLKIITHIINTSISSNAFPTLWRNALVQPIPKKDHPDTYKDLRPISILPCMSKILEKIVHRQVVEYLETNRILPDLQSGFRRQRGTATALTDVVDNIIRAQDGGMSTILVYLDYSRAFDTLNIPLLLAKLSYYGFTQSAVSWFDSYLNNRTQTVMITGENGKGLFSRCRSVERGIPQGSILGPLLFILYTADIINNIQFCKFHSYADDIQLYLSFKPDDTHDCLVKLNGDLDRISTWSANNTLLLNADKTKFMILGTPKQVAVWNEVDGKTKLITAANFCQNGKFAVVGTYDGRCIFYTTDQLKYHTQIDVRSTRGKNSTGRKISGIEPMPNDDKILVTSNDSRIRLYDLRDLNLSCKYKGYVNVSSQIKASFSHDGKYIVSGSENQCIYIWKTCHDYSKFTSVRRDRNDFWEGIKAHNAVVTCAIFAPNPDHMIRMINEREEKLNAGKSQEEKEEVKSPEGGMVSSSQTGHVLVSADFNGAIRVFVHKAKPKHSSLPASALA